MLAAGAGGLAVGALAGHALADGSSSDEGMRLFHPCVDFG